MEIRVLKYFLAVAREQTISGAANFLHLSQPTLSRQLKDLEDEFGKQLFIRGNKKITLTEDGILLRKRAEEIIELVQKTENEMTTENIEGNICIGTGETEAVDIIAKCIKKMKEKYPDVFFNISSDDGQDVLDNLDKGLIDFGIVLCPFDKSKYNYLTLPVKDVWGILMRKDSTLAKLDYISSKDLIDKPLIISREVPNTLEFTKWIKKDLNKLNIIATYNLVYNASILVKNGLGYALTLDKLVNTSEYSDFRFKPLYPKLDLEINIIWKKYQIFSKPADVFLKILQKEIDTSD